MTVYKITIPDGYKLKDDVIEIFVRDVKKRCKSIPKIKLEQLNDNKAHDTIQEARKIGKKIDKSLKGLSTKVDLLNLNTEKLSNNIQKIGKLQYFGIALQAANIVVDIAGFMAISHKLKMLNDDIAEQSQKVDKIYDSIIIDKIKDCDKYFLDSNSLCDSLSNNEEIDVVRLESTVNDMKRYLDVMIGYYNNNTMDIELIMKVIHTLLPFYSRLVSSLLSIYYLEKGRPHVNRESYCTIYESLLDDNFINRLYDYYFITKDNNRMESLDIVTAHKIIVGEFYLENLDMIEVVEKIGNRDNYNDYLQAVNTEVNNVKQAYMA